MIFFSRSELDRRLFVANEPSQVALLKVRELCEFASNSLTGVGKDGHAIWMLHVDALHTCSLEDFKTLQETQTARAAEQLSRLRNQILIIVKDACEVVILESMANSQLGSRKLRCSIHCYN